MFSQLCLPFVLLSAFVLLFPMVGAPTNRTTAFAMRGHHGHWNQRVLCTDKTKIQIDPAPFSSSHSVSDASVSCTDNGGTSEKY